MRRTMARAVAVVGLVAALLGGAVVSVLAVHEGTNVLVFAPTRGSPAAGATGGGLIDFNGGPEPTSRWTLTLRFGGLAPETDYTVVVQGRVGEDGSAEAGAFSPLCAFRTSAAGEGACWDYLRGLRRLGVAQVRRGDGGGPPVLQATRADGGPGSIQTVPNPHSPSPPATPPPARAESR